MPPRRPPIRPEVVCFADRGAGAQAAPGTLDAYRLAGRLGATGVRAELDHLGDGTPVLAGPTHVGRVLRRPLSSLSGEAIPGTVVPLAEFYEGCGVDAEILVDVRQDQAAQSAVEIAAGYGARRRLWLAGSEFDRVVSWRDLGGELILVFRTRMRRLADGPERLAARLAACNVDAVLMHYSDWTGGLTSLFHRFGIEAIADGAEHTRMLVDALDSGVDAVCSPHVDRMVEAWQQVHGEPSGP